MRFVIACFVRKHGVRPFVHVAIACFVLTCCSALVHVVIACFVCVSMVSGSLCMLRLHALSANMLFGPCALCDCVMGVFACCPALFVRFVIV